MGITGAGEKVAGTWPASSAACGALRHEEEPRLKTKSVNPSAATTTTSRIHQKKPKRLPKRTACSRDGVNAPDQLPASSASWASTPPIVASSTMLSTYGRNCRKRRAASGAGTGGPGYVREDAGVRAHGAGWGVM